ncbi:MAG: helix-turn-helix domain-containing protein [Gammaproteobacteria bacterium]|nr:helix-turn-helix domain-containing protein [Gammaproteobacteria bacterium]
MLTIASLLSGFSIFSALILALSHFNPNNYPEQTQARYMGIVLVLTLAGLQLSHYIYLQDETRFIHSGLYQMLLFAVAPTFYLFSRPLLKGTGHFHISQLFHALPVVAAPWLPSSIALPLAFAVGAGYLLWLMNSLYALREQRSRFHLEITVLGTTFLIALAVLIMGLSLPILDEKLFFSLYASAIGSAFILINLLINLTPKLPAKIVEAAFETYATTTLSNVDCEATLNKLSTLMSQDKIYDDPELDLLTLASRIGLSSHQLSELINTRLGKGFSRYVREQRVEAAKVMLLAEPSASVLSVGMSVGFTSQSNFYDAFREITDMTPGKFRKIATETATK